MRGIHFYLPLLLLVLWSCSLDDEPAGSGKGAHLPGEGVAHDPNSILVKLEAGQAAEPVRQLLDATLVKTISMGRVRFVVLRLPDGVSATMALSVLQGRSGFIMAEPNYLRKKFLLPDDPRFGDQYAHARANAAAAWDVTTGSAGVTVAIVDSGVNGQHPDLAPNMIGGYDCVSNTNITAAQDTDADGHGTHVAGIAAARGNNGTGVAGVAWNCRIMPVKVLDADGQGTDADVAQGIVWAATNAGGNRLVINLSLGGDSHAQIIQDAVQFAMQQNAVVVAAMGNDSQHKVQYPAYVPGVIAVGSTDSADLLSSFSTRGKHISVSAPGSDILSTANDGGYVAMSGTSMATPYVSGLCALLLAKSPALTAGQVRSIIELSAADRGNAGFDDLYGHGRVDCGAALAFAATNKFGAILVRTLNPSGAVGNLEVVLCDSRSNVLRSLRTSLGDNYSSVSNGSAMFYYVPAGDYVLKASWGVYLKTMPLTVYSSNTGANPAVALFQLGYTEMPLTMGSWAEGALGMSANNTVFYYCDVLAGQTYAVQWNEKDSGTGSYTGPVKVTAYREDRTTPYFENVDSGFALPRYFTALATERIWLKVDQRYSNMWGSFAIKLFTAVLTSIEIPLNAWVTNTVAGGDAIFFYFDALAGQQYAVQWDDSYSGSGGFTQDIRVSAFRNDQATPYFNSIDSGYNTSQVFTAADTERVYVQVVAKDLAGSGTFRCRVGEIKSTEQPINLATWKSNMLGVMGSDWYYFDGVAGHEYTIRIDDRVNGSGIYSSDVQVSGYSADKTTLLFYKYSASYSYPYSFTASADGRIYLKVEPVSAIETGSYGIRVGEITITESPMPLPLGSWVSNYLPFEANVWHYFNAVKGERYLVYHDEEGYYGSGAYNLNTSFSAWESDRQTSYFTYFSQSYDKPILVRATEDARIYLKTAAYAVLDSGSYAIRVVPVTNTPVPLVLGTWHSNYIESYAPKLVYFQASKGQRYAVDFLDSNSYSGYSLSGDCYIYHSDMLQAFGSASSSYNPSYFFTDTEERVYLEVGPSYSSSGSGSFAIRVQQVPMAGLSQNVWRIDGFDAANKMRIYYFDAVAGRRYAIQWDNGLDGTGTYTSWAECSAYRADQMTEYFSYVSYGYSSPREITAAASERVYLLLSSYWYDEGTFAVRYYQN